MQNVVHSCSVVSTCRWPDWQLDRERKRPRVCFISLQRRTVNLGVEGLLLQYRSVSSLSKTTKVCGRPGGTVLKGICSVKLVQCLEWKALKPRATEETIVNMSCGMYSTLITNAQPFKNCQGAACRRSKGSDGHVVLHVQPENAQLEHYNYLVAFR